jgi:hypothetical protein
MESNKVNPTIEEERIMLELVNHGHQKGKTLDEVVFFVQHLLVCFQELRKEQEALTEKSNSLLKSRIIDEFAFMALRDRKVMFDLFDYWVETQL